MLELIWPGALALLPLPLLIRRVLPAGDMREAALRAPFFATWRELHPDTSAASRSGRGLAAALLCAVWLGLLLGLARPVWVGDPVNLPSSGRDLLLAVDISASMQYEDMRVGQNRGRRIDAVKQVVGDFVDRRGGDRLGLILFGSNAYLQAPLTFDTETVRRFLNEARTGFAGPETAIGDAIGLAVKRLRDRPAENRLLILLTDGANTAGAVRPVDAARLAADNGVRIHTIGVGADKMELPGLFGTSFGSRTVNPSKDLDEGTLRNIAERTGGRYFRARDPAELGEIYRLLDALEPVDQDAAVYRPRASLFHWPVGFAFLCACLLLLSRWRNT